MATTARVEGDFSIWRGNCRGSRTRLGAFKNMSEIQSKQFFGINKIVRSLHEGSGGTSIFKTFDRNMSKKKNKKKKKKALLDSTPQSNNQMTSGSGSCEDNSVDDPDITTTTTTTTTTTKASRNDRDIRFFFQKNSNSKKKEGKNNKKKRARKEGASNFVDLSKDTTPYSPDKTIVLKFLSFDGRQQILRQKDISRLTEGKTDEERYANDELVNFYLSYIHTEFEKAHPGIASRIFIFSSHFYSQLTVHGRFNY